MLTGAHPLLEDLQWADAESVALLAQVSADLSDPSAALPLLIVASYRDDEAPRLPPALPAMRTLRLDRLDQSRIEALCEAMLGPAGRDGRLIELVARETEGNTYFIVEVLRALAEEAGVPAPEPPGGAAASNAGGGGLGELLARAAG